MRCRAMLCCHSRPPQSSDQERCSYSASDAQLGLCWTHAKAVADNTRVLTLVDDDIREESQQ
jgi:hypothetical protein